MLGDFTKADGILRWCLFVEAGEVRLLVDLLSSVLHSDVCIGIIFAPIKNPHLGGFKDAVGFLKTFGGGNRTLV